MLSLSKLDKVYGATHAVRAVSLEVAPGTVLGLVGENGAGKSTLIKMVSGAVSPDEGGIALDGTPILPGSTHEALRRGIAGVFQELTLVPDLEVAENLLLDRPPITAWGSIDRRRMHRLAAETLARYGLDIGPGARLAELGLGRRQMLEVVRALERRPRVLLLDEATSALGAAEVDWLAGHVERVRAEGTIVLFISHRWDEVVRFCSRVAVLRNGELMAVADTAALSEAEALRLMTGRSSDGGDFPRRDAAGDAIALAVRGLASPALDEVSLSVRRGEIVGLGGLVGQGQGQLLESLFGAHRVDSGSIMVGDRPLARPSPARAIAAGLAYVPQERKTEGLLLSKSIARNMTLAVLDRLAALGASGPAAEAGLVAAAIARAHVVPPEPHRAVGRLSGGNQQKVLLEKWLLTQPAVLLLNDVTRGVDVGTKRQIYERLARIAADGVAILWYSTDARELVGTAHRVLVMLGGRITAELQGDALTESAIVEAGVFGSRGAAA